jgi:hypothetical protein
MQIHPLVTVKKAAAVLGVDKKIIRQKLTTGEIQGERRRVGEKDKWFVYHGAVQNLLESERLPELQEKADRVSTEGLTELFEDDRAGDGDQTIPSDVALAARAAAAANGDATASDVDVLQIYETAGIQNAVDLSSNNADRAAIAHLLPSLDEFLHQLTIEFAHRLSKERGLILRLQQDVAMRDEQLQKVPTLEKKLRQAKESMQTRNLEVANLQERVIELETQLANVTTPWWKKLFA